MNWIKIFTGEAEARQRIAENRGQLVVIGTARICLARYGNRFFAVQDACTHNSESLSKGKINHLGEVICPWHGYRFELKTGRACDSSCSDLVTYPLKIDESGFFIGL
jgi:nitrite reductase/ring-hydroxylating ferredoxin subunit